MGTIATQSANGVALNSMRRRTRAPRVAGRIKVIEIHDGDPGMTKEKWNRITHILRTKPKGWQRMMQRMAEYERHDDG